MVLYIISAFSGKVAEWSIAPHSKCGKHFVFRGFESPPFRQSISDISRLCHDHRHFLRRVFANPAQKSSNRIFSQTCVRIRTLTFAN